MKKNVNGQNHRINVGCGKTPTPGWINYDNSLSVRLSKFPLLSSFLSQIGLISVEQNELILAARKSGIEWANATVKIPHPSGTLQAIYTSHMVEHLDREEIGLFLDESYRVLKPGGVIRIVVPDLRLLVESYIKDNDADQFVDALLLSTGQPKDLISKIKLLIVGYRQHLWMYDGLSLSKLLTKHGFDEPMIMAPGTTNIPDYGELDLYERSETSVCVEAKKPNQ